MLLIILLFIALTTLIYFFDRPIIPEPMERDPSALALAEKIAQCARAYGSENVREKEFANCQSNCSKNTDDRIRICIDACQAIADQFGSCANQAIPAK
jgi:hypothetical protein